MPAPREPATIIASSFSPRPKLAKILTGLRPYDLNTYSHHILYSRVPKE
jgi:hypothetical protein